MSRRAAPLSAGLAEAPPVCIRHVVPPMHFVPLRSVRAAAGLPAACPCFAVESRTGAPALGSGGCSGAFASGLSPAPMTAFPVPAHQTGRADFPHPAFGRDHAFALGRPMVVRVRRTRLYSPCCLSSGKCTVFPTFTLCFRQSHWRSRLSAPAPVPQASAPRHTPQCPQSSLRPPRQCRRCDGPASRLRRESPRATPCRSARGNAGRVLP